MIYSCIFKNSIKEKVTIEKLGITLEPLSEEEKEEILTRMDALYFSSSAKNKILKFIKLDSANEKNNKELYMFYSKLTEVEKSACFMYKNFLESGVKLTRTLIKKVLKNTVKIDVSEQFNKFIDKEFEIFNINKILQFILYIKGIINLDSNDIYIRKLKPSNELDIVEFSMIYSNISVERKFYYSEVDLNYYDILNFKKFIEYINTERIRDFIIITENLFNSNNVKENRIISDVSILERLLVKHDTNYDIGKQFVLKVGLLLKENMKGFSDSDSSNLSYCYAIRSCLVHGDDKSIVNLPKKYLKLKDEELDKLILADTHYNKRDRAVLLCYVYLDLYIKIPLQQWIYNTDKIEFLKNN